MDYDFHDRITERGKAALVGAAFVGVPAALGVLLFGLVGMVMGAALGKTAMHVYDAIQDNERRKRSAGDQEHSRRG
jgi:hypothetical protein